jgi:hypothetical protein
MKSFARLTARAGLQRRRFGYRRLGLMLKHQSIKLNAKKLYRLYKEERLTVRKEWEFSDRYARGLGSQGLDGRRERSRDGTS